MDDAIVALPRAFRIGQRDIAVAAQRCKRVVVIGASSAKAQADEQRCSPGLQRAESEALGARWLLGNGGGPIRDCHPGCRFLDLACASLCQPARSSRAWCSEHGASTDNQQLPCRIARGGRAQAHATRQLMQHRALASWLKLMP
jgi:hypothetical protein